MPGPLGTVHASLSRASPWVGAVASTVLILLLGVADLAVGPELSTSVFYVAPISLAAWYVGTGGGLGTCVLAAVVWYGADRMQGVTYSAEWIGFWNAGVRLAFFVIVTLLLRRLAALVHLQRALAETDALTGLANARRFRAALATEVARAARHGGAFSLAYVDLDGFKGVNDQRGHAAGDRVLTLVGHTLATQVRATDLPARLGGDEFAILLVGTDHHQAPGVVAKLRTGLEGAMRDGGWPVGFSIGVVTSVEPSAGADELIRRADGLMYRVKRAGKGSTAFERDGAAAPEA